MRRKLWPKAPAKEGALGQISINFQVYFILINFFKKPNKKKITIEPKSYTAILINLFFHSLLSTCPKKMETEKWPEAETRNYSKYSLKLTFFWECNDTPS